MGVLHYFAPFEFSRNESRLAADVVVYHLLLFLVVVELVKRLVEQHSTAAVSTRDQIYGLSGF